MLSEGDIKLFERDIKLSERVNYVVRTRYYVARTRYFIAAIVQDDKMHFFSFFLIRAFNICHSILCSDAIL